MTGLTILVRAISIAVLCRIAWNDVENEKIANRDVLILALLALVLLVPTAFLSGDFQDLALSVLAAFAIFAALLVFWLLRKIGAGDVKLIGVAPLVAGSQDLLVFAILLLCFVLLAAVLIYYAPVLPSGTLRRHAEKFHHKGVMPFGLPIAASLIGVIVIQTIFGPAAIQAAFGAVS